MTTALLHDFHTDLAQTISNEIQFKRSNYYYFLGKVETWGVNDYSPTSILDDTQFNNNLVRSNALFMKRIGVNDISLVTKRYDWVSGVVFQSWDNTKDMKDCNFYCVTEDFNVYKCLNNNGNSPSLVKPYSKSYTTIQTSDGYVWKYMYSIPSLKITRFMSNSYIPVQKSLTDSFYNKGSVESVTVNNSGNGYVDAIMTYINVSGTTVGSGAIGKIVTGEIGDVIGITIVNGGANYYGGARIKFSTANGYNAVATPIITNGIITGVTITSSGTGYVNGEFVTFSVGGASVVASISRMTGSIEKVYIIDAGAGYIVAPTLTVVSSTGNGRGKYGNTTALLSTIIYNGSIERVNILDPGIEYPVDNNTTLVVRGDGENAEFSPVIVNGELIDVIVENSGSGYNSITIDVIGSGDGATVSPVISASDLISDQSVIEQTTVVGAIYSIQITNSGNNYSQYTEVRVVGDGSGCEAYPIIVNGSIQKIIITNFGHNYNYAEVLFVDTLRLDVVSNVNAEAYVVIPPNNGHGFDAVDELFGNILAINSSLRQASNVDKLLQDYRQFGIIKNPKNILTSKTLNETTSLMAYEVNFDSVADLVVDEILIQNNVKFRVISITGSVVILQQLGNKYINLVGDLFSVDKPERTYTINYVIKYPTADKYSGKLLYVSQENPFSFSEEQGIIIKTFIKY